MFVALCDNQHQGIVPVPAALGNGDDPANNLYWGAMYGTKSFLKKSKAWSLVAEEALPEGATLERVTFRHVGTGGYLVADAYRGSKIRQAVADFLVSAGGGEGVMLEVGQEVLGLKGNADLVVYVGHNGLMDFQLEEIAGRGARCSQGAMVLACKSKPYFLPRLTRFGCRPALLTTGFMAPEAYTVDAAVGAWLSGGDGAAIREEAARAYHKYQKCGLNGARRLFFSGSLD